MEPKKHRFHYNVFMFCVDLDSMNDDFRKIPFVSRNRFNLFSFYDKDHPVVGTHGDASAWNVREELNSYLQKQGVEIPAKVLLITNLRLLGYVFNPVSFYYCYDKNNQPLCAVVEVQNTFKEMKMYFIGKDKFDGKEFHLRTPKYFYVSPFIDHDAEFDFHLMLPTDKMNIRIDDFKDDKRFFISTLTGKKKELTSGRLIGYFFRFPFITLKIITLIHWHAMLLWFKKIRFFRKKEFPELQREVMRPYEKR